MRVAAHDVASSAWNARHQTKVGSAASFGRAANVGGSLLSANFIYRRGINKELRSELLACSRVEASHDPKAFLPNP